MKSPLITTRNLTKIYQMGEVVVHALSQVNLSIDEGQFVVLLGQSGSGKSTLLNILGALDSPTEGEIFYRDEPLHQYSDSELTQFRRQHVGFVFQMYNLIPRLTAQENIELVTEICEAPMDAKEALALVGLKERADHFPSQLSGGEQQRVAIARAIAKNPTLLFCDEPTGALDAKTGIMVLDAIQQVNQTLGTTTIVISHNVGIAEMADRVISLKDGQITSDHLNPKKKRAVELNW